MLSISFVIVMWLFDLPTSIPLDETLVLPLYAESQFHCLTPNDTYSHTWKVNGTAVTSNSKFPDVVYITSQELLNGSTQGSLTFTAHGQVNNTRVNCFASDGHHILPQLDYIIIIQGYLSPPDVVYVMEHHSVRFSWSAPFSLNITDSEPDILYYVINLITEDNTTMNMTGTVYLLEPELCLLSEYRVEIAAVNIVGIGDKYTSPSLSLEALNLSGINVIFGSMFPVINIQMSTTCPDDIHYNVELIPTFSTKRIVISNSSSAGQTSLTLSSSDIQHNEYYEAIVRVEGSNLLEHVNISTFDVQTVKITPQNDVKESTDITCHFALGSHIKGCRIVISINLDGRKSIDESGYEQCEYIAIRENGSTEGTVSVLLPRGEYRVVVYDDEDAEVENPAYNTTITISSLSVIQPLGCLMNDITLPTVAEEKIGHSSDTVILAVVIPVAIVILLLISVMAILIYKHSNGTKNCCNTCTSSNTTEQDKHQNNTGINQDVVCGSIPDIMQTTASSSPPSRNDNPQSEVLGLMNNPAYSLCLPVTHLPARNLPVLDEMEYSMDNNPLYTMRMKIITRPQTTNTSPEQTHHYDYVTVGNV